MQQISATELNEHLKSAAPPPILLDVREPWEYERCHIEGSLHLPMAQVPLSLERLDPDSETVVICHHGVRSFQVGMVLEAKGFHRVINLQGGIDAWAREVDPEMPTY